MAPDARIGTFLSREEHGPRDLVRFGAAAADRGFRDISVSDHLHPWIGEQGNSPFVWSVLGGRATTSADPDSIRLYRDEGGRGPA